MDSAAVRETVSKIQDILYGILCDIDDFCKKYHIRYYLSGGTCLGAVRHHGFIPWDDDADIMLPRDDYMRFLPLFAKEFKGKYYVGSLFTDQTWKIQHAMICDLNTELVSVDMRMAPVGVHVDVFPIDGLPEGKCRQFYYYNKLRILSGLRRANMRKAFLPQEKNKRIKSIAAIFKRFINPRKMAYHMDRYAAAFDFNHSKYVAASLPIQYGSRETILKPYMDRELYTLFVDRKFPIPAGYKKYLTNLYDNYMVIPEDASKKGYTHLNKWEIRFLDRENEHGDGRFDVNL